MHRFLNKEWTADQNGFNDTAKQLFENNIAKSIGSPKSFCDVWLSDTGLIWQAKHQTKMKKVYIDEMKKYEPRIDNSPLWDSIKSSVVRVGIENFSFNYAGIDFDIMGIEGEDQFELIKKNKTFYNVNFLEKLATLGNEDALVVAGGGIQTDTVYLSAFTNILTSVTMEPNFKMIDIGLRNAQDNIGAKRSIFVDDDIPELLKNRGIRKDLFTLYTNWTAYLKSPYGNTVTFEIAGIVDNNVEATRDIQGVEGHSCYPKNLSFATDDFLKSDLYKKMGRAKYVVETFDSIDAINKSFEHLDPRPKLHLAFATSVDFIALSMYNAYMHDSYFQNARPDYAFKNFLGMVLINIFDSSLEVLKTSLESINYFRPHVGIVVYNERNKKERILEIERLLGAGYEKVYEEPDQLDPSASCIVYQSLRRKNE